MTVEVLVGQHVRLTSILLFENGLCIHSEASVVSGSDFKSGAEFKFLLSNFDDHTSNELQTCLVLPVIHSKLHKKK